MFVLLVSRMVPFELENTTNCFDIDFHSYFLLCSKSYVHALISRLKNANSWKATLFYTPALSF